MWGGAPNQRKSPPRELCFEPGQLCLQCHQAGSQDRLRGARSSGQEPGLEGQQFIDEQVVLLEPRQEWWCVVTKRMTASLDSLGRWMSEWAWIGLAWGGLFFFLGDPHQNWRHSRRLCQAIPLLSLVPPKRPLCLHSDWARVRRVGRSSLWDRAAPFGVWLAVVAASVVTLMFAFVVMVRPPWWMKPRWLREADADEWRHPPRDRTAE